jgi:predicted amidophosphoribosyltransferase
MWRAAIDSVGRMLFPAACIACGREPGEPLCGSCAATLVVAPPLPPPLGVDRAVAAFVYDGAARELIARVKYRNARHALTFLASSVATAVEPLVPLVHPDLVITWPPTTRARRRARGFDAAELLARRVAARLDLRAVALLWRVDATPQTGRDGADRRRGPQLVVRAVAMPRAVLLVDDVTTTGATFSAAARALRDAGTTQVLAAAAGRTPPPARRAMAQFSRSESSSAAAS